jgi:hypothetical protein
VRNVRAALLRPRLRAASAQRPAAADQVTRRELRAHSVGAIRLAGLALLEVIVAHERRLRHLVRHHFRHVVIRAERELAVGIELDRLALVVEDVALDDAEASIRAADERAADSVLPETSRTSRSPISKSGSSDAIMNAASSPRPPMKRSVMVSPCTSPRITLSTR